MKSIPGFLKAKLAKPPNRLSRATQSLIAREHLGEDFFGGWVPEDIDLFRRYYVQTKGAAGFITDFLGVKTRGNLVPWAQHLEGKCIGDLPIPDDSVRAEAIEYYALLHSYEQSLKDSFTLIELGASFGAWICTAGVIGRRMNKKAVNLVAVEASRFLYDLISPHLADNGIKANSGETSDSLNGTKFSVRLVHGAVATRPGTLYFPVVNSAGENGGQATDKISEEDYVGRQVQYEEVPAVTLSEIFDSLKSIDLLHVDIQGTESEVIQNEAELIGEHVRHMFVGTHSRKIEGELIECLHQHGWILLRERPTRFSFRSDRKCQVGMTTRDGGQYWQNTALKNR